jgi:hypothetical protein
MPWLFSLVCVTKWQKIEKMQFLHAVKMAYGYSSVTSIEVGPVNHICISMVQDNVDSLKKSTVRNDVDSEANEILIQYFLSRL